MKILLVTNDFPPRVGGIQVYLENIYRRLAARHDVTVLAPSHPGDVAYDAAQPLEIVRHPGPVYWPLPSVARTALSLAKRHDAVCFGAVLPMNELARRVDRPVVVHTHGFEVAPARIPGGAALLDALAARSSLVTVVSEYCGRYIAKAMRRAPRIEMLKTGVDLDAFNPGVDGGEVRKRHGLEGRPVVACVSRLVPRKGQDLIVKAMPMVLREVPDAVALIAGGGPYRAALERLVRHAGVERSVRFAGEVRGRDLPPHYAAGDVFAMPCRSRFGGLEVEGLGLVYLEAQATSRPAIAGSSGGAPEALLPGRTGEVVSGRSAEELARVLTRLLANPATSAQMGAAGRQFVEQGHAWSGVAARFESMLAGVA